MWTVIGVAAAVVLGLGSMVAYAYLSGKAHDPLFLDDTSIQDSAAQACTAVTNAITQAIGTRIERIEVGNAAIGGLVAAMNEITPDTLRADPPAIDWIADWQRLLEARVEFQSTLTATASPEFVVPVADGFPITGRMTDVAPDECAQAIALAADP